MNSRREPYIGMPIVLGEYDPFMCANPADRPQRPQPSKPPKPPMPPQRPEPSRPPQSPQRPEPSRPPQPPMPQEPSRPQEPGIESSPRPPQTQQSQPMVVGMAYVPWQKWQQPYDYEKGFQAGTIFPDLDLPFLGYQGGTGK